jgi:hypothetical protein
MSLSGRLQEYSLPEVFKVIDEGQKSGLLNIRIFDVKTAEFTKYCIWVKNGKVVGLSKNLDGQDLITWLSQQSIVNEAYRSQLRRLPYNLKGAASLGDYLKQQNWLSPEQLQKIFESVVLQPIVNLFQVREGFFTFNGSFDIPKTELTGLSITTTNLNLVGLRRLKDWTHLEEKLPEPNAGIVQANTEAHIRQLSEMERQVLAYANGQTSIKRSAQLLAQPIAEIQQIAFRLIAAGLAEELPMISTPSSVSPEMAIDNLAYLNNLTTSSPNQNSIPQPTTVPTEPSNPALSGAFLNNLTSFLQQRMKQPASSAKAATPGIPSS